MGDKPPDLSRFLDDSCERILLRASERNNGRWERFLEMLFVRSAHALLDALSSVS